MAILTKAMSSEAIREHVTSLIRAINEHDVDKVVGHFTEDVLWEDPMLHAPVTGRAAAAKELTTTFTAMPDYHLPFEEVDVYVAEDGRKAAAKWHAVATMTGPLDPPGFAPTGKTVYFPGACFYEFRDGLIARHTILYDVMGVSEKLGLMPGMESMPVKMLARTQRFATTVRRTLLRR